MEGMKKSRHLSHRMGLGNAGCVFECSEQLGEGNWQLVCQRGQTQFCKSITSLALLH